MASVNKYSELEGDMGMVSQDSLDCCRWNQESGRPESPLVFDHEEVLNIKTDESGCVRVLQMEE